MQNKLEHCTTSWHHQYLLLCPGEWRRFQVHLSKDMLVSCSLHNILKPMSFTKETPPLPPTTICVLFDLDPEATDNKLQNQLCLPPASTACPDRWVGSSSTTGPPVTLPRHRIGIGSTNGVGGALLMPAGGQSVQPQYLLWLKYTSLFNAKMRHSGIGYWVKDAWSHQNRWFFIYFTKQPLKYRGLLAKHWRINTY